MKAAVTFLCVLLGLAVLAFAAAPYTYPCPLDGQEAGLQTCQPANVYGRSGQSCTYSHWRTDGSGKAHTFSVLIPD